MRFEEKRVTLINGTIFTLRSPEEGDAEGMLSYLRTTAAETHFLLRTPDEVTMTMEEEKNFLRSVLDDSRRVMICAFSSKEPVANLSVNPVGSRVKLRHRAEFGLAIIRAYWHLGLGSILMREGLTAAKSIGFEQLELAVYADNGRAIRLYERFGFEHWGQIRNAFRLEDGTYRDDLLMGRPLRDLPF